MKFQYSLKKILTIIFVLITAVPVLIMGFFSLNILKDYLTTDIAEKNLLLVKTLRSEVETTIDEHMRTLLYLARLIDMGAILSIENMNLHLKTINEYHEELEMIRILDSNGSVTHISPFNRNYVGINMSYQPFVRATLKHNKPQWSSTFRSPQTRQPTLALCVPLKEGVIVGYLNLKTLKAIIDKVKIGTLGYAYIVDSEGTFIAHPNQSYVAEQINLKYFQDVSTKYVGKEKTFIDKMQGVEVFCNTAIVPNVNWVVRVVQPVAEALETVIKIRNIILTGMIITLIFAVILLMIILKILLTPLTQLTEYSQKIAAGDDRILKHHKSFYEVNALTKNFNLMINALKHREKKIRESESRFRIAGKVAYDLIYEWNVENDSLTWFGDIDKILGWKKGEISRDINAWLNLIHKDDMKQLENAVEVHRESTQPIEYIYRIKKSDGTWRYWDDRALPLLNEMGMPYKWIGVCTDITDKKHAEKELMAAKERAESANNSKSQFLANMSHELRTPINAMLGFSKLLQIQHIGPLNTKQYEYLEYIIESSNRLLALIDDILDLSRVEAGKIEITKAVFNIEKLMKRIEITYASLITKQCLTFQVSLAPDVPKYFISDEYRIEQILKNLVSNAIKFTEQGRIDVFVNMKSDNELLFEVRDTGIGIPIDKVNSLFDKFFQADSSYAKKFSGAGLGLAISKELVELLGGTIWLESNVGKGSAFFFTLTVDMPDADLIYSYEKACESANLKVVSKRKLNILLAEDDPLNSKSMIHFLNKAGHVVTHAENGNEVLYFMETMTFDIILMDIQMPDLDGVETTKRIRHSDSGKLNSEIPIIALTAYAMRGDKEKFIRAGVNDYATKPVDINKLLEKVNQFVIDENRTVIDDQDKINSVEKALIEESIYVNEISDFIGSLNEDVGFQQDILTTFLYDSQKRMDQLEKAITSDHINEIVSLSHSITGMLASIQIFSVAKLSKNLESAARSNEYDKIGLLYQDLKAKMHQLNDLIRSNYLI
jgi:PAS domain S-box-containing protein